MQPPSEFTGTLAGNKIKTHIIYHIPGKKFGCTENLEERRKWYKTEIRKLIITHEILFNCSHQEAGDREKYWNDLFQYNGAAIAVKSGRFGFQTMSPEKMSEVARKGGKRTGELGKAGLQTMTHNQRVKIGQQNAAKIPPEIHRERMAIARQKRNELGLLTPFQKQGTCPHCGIITHLAALARWHNERCRKHPKNNE